MNFREYIGQVVKVVVDRPLGSKHHKYNFIYSLNYGYIPNIISGDGEELDAYILGEFEPLDFYEGRVVAIVHRLNDNDDKLIVAKDGKDYTDEQIMALVEFQERWFKTEILR